MGGGTSLKHLHSWFTSLVKKRCAKSFKLGTSPHKCVQWRRIGFYGSCLWVLQSDSELAWPVPKALMATMKLPVMKVPVASQVASQEWPSCYVLKFTALWLVNWAAADSCLQMFLYRDSVSRFKAAWVPVPQCQSLARCCQDQNFQVEALAGDVMAGAGGAAGPVQDVQHQPPGDGNEERAQLVLYIHNQCKKQYQRVDTHSAVVIPVESNAQVQIL
jgi:hypothetical protein